jgi:hypothetical protein
VTIAGGADPALFSKVNAAAGDAATLDAESKVKITSGGNMSVGAGGNISISGGGAPAAFTSVAGIGGKATLTADASVLMSTGGNLTLTLAGGNLNIQAGSAGGLLGLIGGLGAGGAAAATMNAQINLLAKGALKVSGAHDITRSAGNFPSHAVVGATSGATAKAKVDQSITLSGTAITLGHTGSLAVHNGASSGTFAGLTELGKVKNVIHAPGVTPVPLAAAAVFTSMILPAARTLDTTQDLGALSSTALGPQTIGNASLTLTGSPLVLGTLSDQGLIMNLETIVAPALMGKPQSWYRIETQSSTDYTPVTGAASYLDSFSSPCTAIVLKEEGSKACVAAN